MSIYQRIKDLANERHVSIAQVERDLGLSNGSMAKWDAHSPKSENLKSVANYFSVSTDFILGNDAKDNSIQYFRIDTSGLSDDQVEALKKDLSNYSKWAKQQLKEE